MTRPLVYVGCLAWCLLVWACVIWTVAALLAVV